MNNPMSLMADASKLSIPQLQQAIKNGTVPPYIGVPLLQQKVKESQQAKQAMAMQQPMQQPVAQAVMQQAQGVSGLPTNLPEQSMAGGGIISFAEGGTYGSADYDPSAMEQDYRANANKQYQDYISNRVEYGPGQYFGNAKQNYDAYQLKANTRTPYDDAINYAIANGYDPREAVIKKDAWLKNPTNLMENAVSHTADTTKPAVANAKPSTQVSPAGDKGILTPPTQYKERDYAFGNPSTSYRGSNIKASANQGIGGYKITPYDTSYIDELKKGDNNPATGKPYTKEELSALRKQDFINAGGDPDVYKTQKEAAEKAGAKTDSEKRLDEAAPWFAVSKAFGEARPNEGILGTIGKAMGAYGTEAGANIKADKLQAEATRKELGQIALAQNAYSQARADGDTNAMQKANDAMDAHTTLLGNIKNKGADQQNEMNKTVFEAHNKENVARIMEHGANSRAGQAQQAITRAAAAIHIAHPDLAPDEVIKQAYLTVNAAGVYRADTASDSAAQKNLISLMNGITKASLGMKLSADKQREYDGYASQLAALGGGTAPAAPVNTIESHLKNGFKIN